YRRRALHIDRRPCSGPGFPPQSGTGTDAGASGFRSPPDRIAMKLSLSTCTYPFPVLILLLFTACIAAAQEDTPAPVDTVRIPASPVDTLAADTLRQDSIALGMNRSGMDTVVDYSARDSIVFDVKSRLM